MMSVIIPFYNHHEALQKSLQTLIAQTEKDIELIIVDDGSAVPLSSKEVKAVYTRPFTLIRQENAGAPAARNAGFKASHGEYVIFWDADIVAKPTMLRMMREALEKHPEASFAYSDHRYLGGVQMRGMPWDYAKLRTLNFIHSSSLIRRDADLFWDETLQKFQDWDLWLTLGEQKKVGAYIPECLFSIIPRKEGMSMWMPRLAYHFPFRLLPWWKKKVDAYCSAQEVVMKKHGLSNE